MIFQGHSGKHYEFRIRGKGGEKLMVLNVKDFPEDLHRKAKAEAALMGISLKELIIRAINEYIKKSKRS